MPHEESIDQVCVKNIVKMRLNDLAQKVSCRLHSVVNKQDIDWLNNLTTCHQLVSKCLELFAIRWVICNHPYYLKVQAPTSTVIFRLNHMKITFETGLRT